MIDFEFYNFLLHRIIDCCIYDDPIRDALYLQELEKSISDKENRRPLMQVERIRHLGYGKHGALGKDTGN